MPGTVHLFSGDAAAARRREAGGAGATVVWREALVAGPLGAPLTTLCRRVVRAIPAS